MFRLGGGTGGLPPGVTTNDWRAQAKHSVDGMREEKYRSAALRIEVKLAEALGRAPPKEARALERNPRPDKFRTAVCMELMGDLCELAGPFSETLRTIREELAKGLYSDYYLADSDALAFDQLPYFVVVERLAGEKVRLAEELARWKGEIADRDRAVRALEATVETMKTSASRAAAAERDLERRLLEAEAAAVTSEAELKETAEELKTTRKELLAAKEELLLMRAENLSMKGPTGALTPRPDWNDIDPYGKEVYDEDRTLDLVHKLCDELGSLKTKTAELAKFEEAMALIQPEAEAHDWFEGVEEEEPVDPKDNSSGPPTLPTLGSGPEVPRFLRSVHERVRLQKLSKRDTEFFIEEVWEGKERLDAKRKNPHALHEYMYDHLREKFKGDHGAVVEFGYNLFVSLRKYEYDADVSMFLAVLTGALSEHVRDDRAALTSGLMDLLGAAAGHPSLIGRDDLATTVAAFFPSKSEGDIAKLVEAARRDQPDGEFVDFIKLFEEDSKKNQGEFVTMIYAQHWREITAYDAEVTAAIRSVGKGAVPLLAVREALRKVDPTSTDEDVDARVAKGASLSSVSEVKTRCELGATVETEAFVSRLHTGLLKRRDNFDLAAVRKYRPEGTVSHPVPASQA